MRRRNPPSAPRLWCRLCAANRNACAARLTPRRVRLDLTRPPVFFQLGHSPSQLQNFFTVANRDTPGPAANRPTQPRASPPLDPPRHVLHHLLGHVPRLPVLLRPRLPLALQEQV